MRDYGFGNFLYELRVRRGLSQFQLGMLVGVSDKAVSKWENGLAKPQSGILYKLSEALGITIDELLACKCRAGENANEKRLLAVEKTLWKRAGEALRGLYGDVPPVEAADRYFSEYAGLKGTGHLACFELLGRMAKRIRQSGGHMRVNGGIGASFVAYLMGATDINPLRPHYYCPHCHKISFVEGCACGWDLPARKCACGGELQRDGHDLPFETLRPLIRKPAKYAVSVSQDLHRAAQEEIRSFFQETGLKQYPAVTLLPDGELEAWGRLERETGISFENVPFLDERVLDAFIGGDTGGIPEFGPDFARAVMAQSPPACIRDLIQIPGLCHGTGVWRGNGEELAKAGLPLGSLTAYRDDVFRCIQERMPPGSGSGLAYHVMEEVRRGAYARHGIPADIRQQLLGLGVEERLIEAFGKIGYLFPRAHGITHVRHAMILMWYKMNYPEAASRLSLTV